ncbi:hypothetical protein ACI65C_011703 [Semiaphis heraclei]
MHERRSAIDIIKINLTSNSEETVLKYYSRCTSSVCLSTVDIATILEVITADQPIVVYPSAYDSALICTRYTPPDDSDLAVSAKRTPQSKSAYRYVPPALRQLSLSSTPSSPKPSRDQRNVVVLPLCPPSLDVRRCS